MKTKTRILGLTLCLGMLLSIGAIQNNVSANAGWAISKAFDANEAGEVALTGSGIALGAYAGFELGASVGVIGGPLGVAVGGALGAL